MDFSTPNSLSPELRQEAKDRELKPGQVLFNFQDRAEYIFALQKGRIRLESTREGDLVIFYIIRTGESFAESALFSETYRWNAIVEIPSSVVFYPQDIIWQTLNNKPRLALDFLSKLDRQTQS